MKITAIRATPVNIPLELPYLWSYGALAGFSKTIVEVETDEGIVGLGEGPSPANVATIEKTFAPRLVGRDPFDIQGAEERCLPSWRGVGTIDVDLASIRAFGAIEMALWDIRGKAWGQPLHRLLGGAHRTAIPFTDYFAFREGGESTPEEVRDYCAMLNQRHGTTMFEGKLSTTDPAPSIRVLELLRDALGPGAVLRVDSNKAYSLTEARRIARAIEPLDIRAWEDPVATFEEMAQLRRHTAIPFSVHTPDIRRAVALGVPDAFCTDVNVHGGIGRTLRFIGACEAMNLDFWCYSGDSGIASAAYLHLAAALPHIREPSQSLFRMQPLDVIEEGPFRPVGNLVPVPQGPGLGVTLSREQLAHCHKLFLEQGPYDKFRDPDRPGVFRRLPLEVTTMNEHDDMPPLYFTYLNRFDVEALKITDDEIMAAVEGQLATQGRGEAVIEPRMHLEPGVARGHFNVLRGSLGGEVDSAGVKVVSDFYDNYLHKLPSELALLLLFDRFKGVPKAIIDASAITDMRTGAVTAVGAKYLAPKGAKVLGHIGARGTAYWNVRLMDRIFDFDEIRVHSRRKESRDAFGAKLERDLGKKIVVTDDWESCIRGADIVVEASRLTEPEPLLKTEWIKRGALVMPYGTMSAVELSLADIADKFLMDDFGQARAGRFGSLKPLFDAGKLHPGRYHAEIGQVVAGLKPGRERDDETILFWHRGLSLSDIALGHAMLKKGEQLGIGQRLRFRMSWIANARMYAVAPEAEAAWQALIAHVAADAHVALDYVPYPAPKPLEDLWRRPDLGCVQMCGYPIALKIADVVPLAAPIPALDWAGGRAVYRSDLIVRADSPFRTLEDSFGHRVGWTVSHSHSGFNALRYHLLPHWRARGGRLYAESIGDLVTARRILDGVLDGSIDIGPLDAFWHALIARHRPDLTAGIRVLESTDVAPMPAFVAAPGLPADAVAQLRAAFAAASSRAWFTPLAAPLLIAGFAPVDRASFATTLAWDREAVAAGYPVPA